MDFTSALKDSPPNPALYFLRGSVKLQLKNWKGAAEDFEAGLKLDPNNAPLQALLKQARESDTDKKMEK